MMRVLPAASRPSAPRRTVRRLMLAPAAALLTLLAACTGGGPDAPTGAPSPSGPAASAINPQPRNVVAEGGELRLPVEGFGDQWNPLHADADDDQHRLIMGSLVPRLFNYDAEGNPSPNPDYLSAVHATGENPQVVTYTLNPNAIWGDGQPIDVDDFIANWEACNGQNVSFDCANTKHLSQVASIEQGTSPQQVVVTYRGAYTDWPSTFFFLLPEESVKDPETFNEGWTDLTDVDDWLGGPFEVSSYDSDADVLIEKPNPDWWGEKPKLSQLTFRQVDDSDQVQALQDHQLDVADISSDSDEVDTVNKIGGCEVRVATVPGSGERQLIAARQTLANYGAFGKSTINWPDVGYLAPSS